MLPCMVAITNDGVAGFGLELSQVSASCEMVVL
jgi:hypothetical protein